MASNLNLVAVTGNLTRDPELRQTNNGTSVCSLRIAVNTRRKDPSGEWVDKPNYFDVTVWGAQGENVAKYLSKGSALAVKGELEWREYEDKEAKTRQAVQIVADLGGVQFLSSAGSVERQQSTPTGAPAEEPAAATAQDDDIPF